MLLLIFLVAVSVALKALGSKVEMTFNSINDILPQISAVKEDDRRVWMIETLTKDLVNYPAEAKTALQPLVTQLGILRQHAQNLIPQPKSPEILQFLCSEKSPSLLVICGAAGIGKTTLAGQLLWNPRIREKFTSVFYSWGESITSLSAKNLLLVDLPEGRSLNITIDDLQRNHYVVFVRNLSAVDNLLGAADELYVEIVTLLLPSTEACTQYMTDTAALSSAPKTDYLLSLVHGVGRLPMALKIARSIAILVARKKRGGDVWQQTYMELLGKHDEKEDAKDPVRGISLADLMKTTFDMVPKEHRELFLQLGVLPAHAELDVSTCSVLWSCDSLDAKKILQQFVDASLISTVFLASGRLILTLHETIWKYIQPFLKPQLKDHHRAFVASYLARCGDWAKEDLTMGPLNQHFLQYLNYHVAQAGMSPMFAQYDPSFAFERYWYLTVMEDEDDMLRELGRAYNYINWLVAQVLKCGRLQLLSRAQNDTLFIDSFSWKTEGNQEVKSFRMTKLMLSLMFRKFRFQQDNPNPLDKATDDLLMRTANTYTIASTPLITLIESPIDNLVKTGVATLFEWHLVRKMLQRCKLTRTLELFDEHSPTFTKPKLCDIPDSFGAATKWHKLKPIAAGDKPDPDKDWYPYALYFCFDCATELCRTCMKAHLAEVPNHTRSEAHRQDPVTRTCKNASCPNKFREYHFTRLVPKVPGISQAEKENLRSSALGEELTAALAAQRCTFEVTFEKDMPQKLYKCVTCDQPERYMCEYCIHTCHVGHESKLLDVDFGFCGCSFWFPLPGYRSSHHRLLPRYEH